MSIYIYNGNEYYEGLFIRQDIRNSLNVRYLVFSVKVQAKPVIRGCNRKIPIYHPLPKKPIYRLKYEAANADNIKTVAGENA
jgi:hypothetical protein